MLLAGADGGGRLTFWVVVETQRVAERVALARASQAEHLQLQSNLYGCSRRRPSLLIGDRGRSGARNRYQGAIDANLAEIQRIIAARSRSTGERELEELRSVGVGRTIDDINTRYDAILRLTACQARSLRKI